MFDNKQGEIDQGAYFFDIKIIPKQFETAHLTLLDEVVSFFDSKYQLNGNILADVS